MLNDFTFKIYRKQSTEREKERGERELERENREQLREIKCSSIGCPMKITGIVAVYSLVQEDSKHVGGFNALSFKSLFKSLVSCNVYKTACYEHNF